jgi:hypothetical protein
LFIGRRDIPQQLVERDHVTPELLARANAAQRYLLDIKGAEARVGYPPMHKEARSGRPPTRPAPGSNRRIC